MKLKATLVDDVRSVAGKVPGAVEFRSIDGEVKGVACRCPCGCGEEMWLPLRLVGAPAVGTRVTWEWNGDRQRAVITPSVWNTGLACRWHGYLGQVEPGYWNNA